MLAFEDVKDIVDNARNNYGDKVHLPSYAKKCDKKLMSACRSTVRRLQLGSRHRRKVTKERRSI